MVLVYLCLAWTSGLILARLIARVHLERSQPSKNSRDHEDDQNDRES